MSIDIRKTESMLTSATFHMFVKITTYLGNKFFNGLVKMYKY